MVTGLSGLIQREQREMASSALTKSREKSVLKFWGIMDRGGQKLVELVHSTFRKSPICDQTAEQSSQIRQLNTLLMPLKLSTDRARSSFYLSTSCWHSDGSSLDKWLLILYSDLVKLVTRQKMLYQYWTKLWWHVLYRKSG